MSQMVINSNILKDIADAIREKNDTEDLMKPGQMAEKIRNLHDVITEEKDIIENGEYIAGNKKAYSVVRVNVPQKQIESIDITQNGTYIPDDDKAYGEINVNIPTINTESINITENGSYTPEEGKACSQIDVNVPILTNFNDIVPLIANFLDSNSYTVLTGGVNSVRRCIVAI